ncbi:MAG: glycosyltransferase family 4 protein, partial [Algoriella sp.]
MDNQRKRINIVIGDIRLSAGTERAVTNLSNNLVSKGHKVRIISLYSSEGSPYYKVDQDVDVLHLDKGLKSNILFRLVDYWILARQLVKYFEKEEIIIGTTHAINCMLAFLSKKEKLKRIGCEHMGYWATTKSTRYLRKRLYPRLDAVVVLTNDDKIEYKKQIPKIKSCYVIPNQFSFYPELVDKERKKQVLAVGRYETQKGFDILLNDLHQLIKEKQDWVFKIIGSGSMKNILEELIKKYQLNNVILSPPTPEIEQEFLESSIYLMTSRNEGLPMVLLEAKACGLPIISYNCPTGPKDLVYQNDGFLIEMENKDDLSSKLRKIMEDKDLR